MGPLKTGSRMLPAANCEMRVDIIKNLSAKTNVLFPLPSTSSTSTSLLFLARSHVGSA